MKDSFLNKKFKYTYKDICKWAALVLVFVFILTNVVGVRIKGFPLVYWMSLIPAFVKHGCVWQFLSYNLIHGSPIHLALNVYAMIVFGSVYERSVGSREFLLFIIVTGVFGGILSYLIYVFLGMTNVAIMGASGIVYALIFVDSVMFPFSYVRLFFLMPMKLPKAMVLFILIEIISQLVGTGASVAHLVHLASIAVAWLYCVVRYHISPWKVLKDNL